MARDRKAYCQAHKKLLNARSKAWNLAHPERVKARSKAWRLAHLEKVKAKSKAYDLEHPEQRRARSNNWKLSHPEYIREYNKNRWLIHKEQEKARMKAYIQTPEGKKAIHRRNSKHRQLGFIALNKPFKGSEGHHIDKKYVIYIPKIMHRIYRHSLRKDKDMKEINEMARRVLKTSELKLFY